MGCADGDQWLTRAFATTLAMSTQFVVGGYHFIEKGMFECLALDHSTFAEVACPGVLEIAELERCEGDGSVKCGGRLG